MNENKNISIFYSWPVIIIALCIFWPVGLYLIIKRVSTDKKTAMASAKLINGFGIASLTFAALGLCTCLDDGFTSSDFAIILFFAGAGYALMRVAKRIKTNAASIKQYLSIIVNGNVRQIDSIASKTGKSPQTVRKDIEQMINQGYLKNAYIDESLREVVLPTNSNSSSQNISNPMANSPIPNKAPVQARIISCKCCGANNTIIGDWGECEYCGAPLK